MAYRVIRGVSQINVLPQRGSLNFFVLEEKGPANFFRKGYFLISAPPTFFCECSLSSVLKYVYIFFIHRLTTEEILLPYNVFITFV